MADNETLGVKLDILIRLQAMALIEKYETQRERIVFLSRAGFGPKAIADIIGTSPNTVNVALSKMRQKEGGKDGNQLKSAS